MHFFIFENNYATTDLGVSIAYVAPSDFEDTKGKTVLVLLLWMRSWIPGSECRVLGFQAGGSSWGADGKVPPMYAKWGLSEPFGRDWHELLHLELPLPTTQEIWVRLAHAGIVVQGLGAELGDVFELPDSFSE